MRQIMRAGLSKIALVAAIGAVWAASGCQYLSDGVDAQSGDVAVVAEAADQPVSQDIVIHPGEQVYADNCAACHDNGEELRAPTLQALQRMSSPQIEFALTRGKMRPQAEHLTRQEVRFLVEYLAPGGSEGYATPDAAKCDSTSISYDGVDVPYWGVEPGNTRYYDDARSALTKANIDNLELAWVFGAPSTTEMRSQPVITDDTVFLSTTAGHIFALDKDSGCTKWHVNAGRPFRGPMTLGDIEGSPTLFLLDAGGVAVAFDADTGKELWTQDVAISPMTLGTSGIVQSGELLFAPLSTSDFGAAADPNYECCKGHGAIVAINAKTGEHVWTAHMTEDATKRELSSVGTQLWGPSGAPIWTTPAVDEANQRIYIGTGENTSAPATLTSDAIIALDMKSGEMLWVYQATPADMYNGACSGFRGSGPNCPTPTGPDHDFGGGVTFTEFSDGRQVVVGGQKSGVVHVVDANTGELIWKKSVSTGSALGGVHWGVTVSNGKIIAPSNDPAFPFPNYTPKPGLFALDLETGEELWSYDVKRGCETNILALRAQDTPWPECSFQYAMSAAPTSNDELVFAPSLDGKIRAFDINTGDVVWTYETVKEFEAVNGVPTHGGSIDNAGVQLSDDMMFALSGYALFNQMPGNAFLAFRVKEGEE